MAKRGSLSSFAAKKGEPAAPQPAPTAESDKVKGQTLRLSIQAWKQLKNTATEEETTMHKFILEALNEAFRKRGKPPIA